MKLIIEKSTNRVVYAVPDSTFILLTGSILAFDTVVATDINEGNATIVENVELPEGFEMKQWVFVDGVFSEFFESSRPPVDLVKMKSQLYGQLDMLSTEMANVIIKCRLNNVPEPTRLTDLIELCRAMYPAAKNEIEALTEETCITYVLRSTKYEQLLNLLKTFL